MTTNMLNGGRVQKDTMTGFDAARNLQMIRIGNRFHSRISQDGQKWTEMPASPIERPDMAKQLVQVGLVHASYGNQSSFISFGNYSVTMEK